MKTIWKWNLQPHGGSANMPRGAQVLAVQTQGTGVSIWALVDPEAKVETRQFAVYGTGHEMPGDPGAYVGTFQWMDALLVFHVFEVTA